MITKKQSSCIQGIAVLLMIFHHFFMEPESMPYNFANIDIVRKAAWFGKICVGLFAFVSGYGIYHVFSKNQKDKAIGLLAEDYKSVFIRILKLFYKLWFVIIICKGIGFVAFGDEFDLLEFVKNMFILSYSYNGSWWYVGQYVKMLLLIPLMDLFFAKLNEPENKRRIAILGTLAGIVVILVAVGFFFFPAFFELLMELEENLRIAFFAILAMGYLVARFDAFNRLLTKIPLNVFVQIIIGIVCIVSVVIIRVKLSFGPTYAQTDFILVPVFVFGILLVLQHASAVFEAFCFVGKYSTYMWLVHALVYDKTVDLLRTYSDSAIVFYIAEVLFAFGLAFILSKLENFIQLTVSAAKKKLTF